MIQPVAKRIILSLVGAAAMVACSGCDLIGVMAASYQEGSDHEVKAEYRGLEGKDFAVVVAADRVIQADQPELIEYLTVKMTERLAGHNNEPHPSGFVPPAEVLKYLYDHPGWHSKPMSELAKGLGGVKRLVFVELYEYQLHEPGNQYEWNGLAAGTVAVVEADSNSPDDFAFERQVSVKFPDKTGMGPPEMSTSAVTTALALRFVDRTAWLMFDHSEPYKITY
jgi:hypothetical protein